MANKIEYSNVLASKFVVQTSRYIDSKVLYYGDDKITTFETYKRKNFVFSKNEWLEIF